MGSDRQINAKVSRLEEKFAAAENSAPVIDQAKGGSAIPAKNPSATTAT